MAIASTAIIGIALGVYLVLREMQIDVQRAPLAFDQHKAIVAGRLDDSRMDRLAGGVTIDD